MHFDNLFFLPEVRDGFYVSSRMKRTWAATLEVYKTVEKLCNDNNLSFFADYGTLLGAARHGGFVPWDDDLDICMKRDDYMSFIEIANTELPDEYACLSIYSNPKYEHLLARVVNRAEFKFGEIYANEFHGFPYNVGIDIFPLDYVNNDEEAEKARCELARALKYHIDLYDAEELYITKNKEDILEIAKGIGFIIKDGEPIRQQLYQMLDRIMSYFGKQHGNKLVTIANYMSHGSKPVDELFYKNTIRIPFENTEITVPLLYDRMLENKYPNYMNCVKNWDTHSYPVYIDIENAVYEAGVCNVWPRYTIEEAKFSIKKQLESIEKERVSDIKKEHKEVVFMPYMASHWKWMEPLWLCYQNDENTVTYVMPIPYYEKNNVGRLGNFHYEGNMLPEYVPITPFDGYDLEARHPYRIVIQNIYDQYDTAISVPPFFYSERIQRFTDCLTTVPDFVIDDFVAQDARAFYNMDFYCLAPGVINAYEVYVQSDCMRNRYIEKLVNFAGEDTRVLWESKIQTATWDVVSNEGNGILEEDIPEYWWPKIINSDENGKILLLYYNSVSCIAEYNEAYIDKVKMFFDHIEKNRNDITVIWIADDSIGLLAGKYYMTKIKYMQLRERYGKESYVIAEEFSMLDKALSICDAFYGDRGYPMHRFERTRRPTMVQSVEIQ